jgi:hypothetical protein
MNVNEEFMEEFGRELLGEIFENIYGDTKSDHISIHSRHYTDRINSYGDGSFIFNGREISFQFQDGNNNGSEITDYGENLTRVQRYATIYEFVLDEDRLVHGGYADSLDLMRKKFDALRDTIAEKQRQYNYDVYHSPGIVVEQHYREWVSEHYLKIVSRSVEVDY